MSEICLLPYPKYELSDCGFFLPFFRFCLMYACVFDHFVRLFTEYLLE